MLSSKDQNNNLKKNPGFIETLYIDYNGNHVPAGKDNSVISKRNQVLQNIGNTAPGERRSFIKRQPVSSGKMSFTNGNYLTNGKPVSNGNYLTNGKPIANDNYLTNDNCGKNNFITNGNSIPHGNSSNNFTTNGNQIIHGKQVTNGNQIIHGKQVTNGNHLSQSDALSFNTNEEILLPFLTDIIKELPELNVNQVSEVLSSFEGDGTSGKIDTPLLDSQQVYQVLSNFNQEFVPFPFQYQMDLFHANALLTPKRLLKSIQTQTDNAGKLNHHNVPDETKTNHNLAPVPLITSEVLEEVTEPPQALPSNELVIAKRSFPQDKPDVSQRRRVPSKDVNNQLQISTLQDNDCSNLQRGSPDHNVTQNTPCSRPALVAKKNNQITTKGKEKSKTNQSKIKPRISRIPVKIGKVKSIKEEKEKHGLKNTIKSRQPAHTVSTVSSTKSFTPPKQFCCDHCPQKFTAFGPLTAHLKTHAKNGPHVCKICKKSFNAKKSLNKHSKTHEEDSHQCATCSKSFDTHEKIVKHRKNHYRERNHKCDVCEKAFTCTSHLKRHALIHTRVQRSAGGDRNKSLSRKKNVKKNANVKFFCKFCLKQFKIEKMFQKHIQKCAKKK